MEQLFWEKAVVLVDMNAFFASIEQLDHPEWQNKPIAVTNGEQGSCIITCSYEARTFGIKTGMRLREAQQLCPQLIQAPSRPRRYTQISRIIMDSLQDITPDIEIFSVDEAFLDITHVQALHGSPEQIANMVKQKIFQVSRLDCSIGVSGDKTTAKYAAKLHKPNGITIIPPWHARDRLAAVKVSELCGIGSSTTAFLASYGVEYCGDMQKLPISILAKRFGNLGRRIWYMAQGKDPSPVRCNITTPKSIGHGKVIPPNTSNLQLICTYLLHMSEKVSARLRRHDMEASQFWVAIKSNKGWHGEKLRLSTPGNDGRQLYQLCRKMLKQQWHGQGIHQVQVTALDPKPAGLQMELFSEYPKTTNQRLNQVMDSVNQRYGAFTLAPARLLEKSEMPDVIAPAWQPTGVRQSL